MTKKISVEEMMESGMHFGHQAFRRNPKMDPYIFGIKSGISIIDLTKTEPLFIKALKFVSETVANGKQIILVGTKRQASNLIKEGAEKCNMPYVNVRWLGGLLTNFETINKRVEYLKSLDEKFKNDDFAGVTKKEKVGLDKVHKSLSTSLGGLRNLKGIPGAIFVVDVIKDGIAIREARKMGVPVVAISDTNVNPDLVDYIIPANDDARKAIEYVMGFVVEACLVAPKVADEIEDDKPEVKEEVDNKAEPRAKSDAAKSSTATGKKEEEVKK